MDKNIKRPAVWQDVRRVKPVPQKPIKKSRFFGIKTLFNKTAVLISKNKFTARISLASSKLSKRNRKIALLSLVVILIILSGFYIKSNIIDTKVDQNKVKIQSLASKNPEYKTVLPTGKTITDLGGWNRISPPDRSAVFTFVDSIDGVQINVSQQPLPAEFKEETTLQIEQLAKSFKADEKVTVGNTEVFIGTSIDGPQSVIFAKNDLLILIKSTSKINSTSWATYIGTLK